MVRDLARFENCMQILAGLEADSSLGSNSQTPLRLQAYLTESMTPKIQMHNAACLFLDATYKCQWRRGSCCLEVSTVFCTVIASVWSWSRKLTALLEPLVVSEIPLFHAHRRRSVNSFAPNFVSPLSMRSVTSSDVIASSALSLEYLIIDAKTLSDFLPKPPRSTLD